VSEILSRPVTVQRDLSTGHLADIVSESSYPPSVRAVTVLLKPLLKLTQCAQTMEDRQTEGDQPQDTELLVHYLDFLDTNTSHRKKDIYFDITFTDHQPDFEAVYSLVLQFSTQSAFAAIKDVQMPFLSRDVTAGKTGSRLIPVELCPEETTPAELTVSATFLGPDGRTYQCLLDPVSVQLSHLMSPLPCPTHWSVATLQPLFDQLWAMMTDSSANRYPASGDDGWLTIFYYRPQKPHAFIVVSYALFRKVRDFGICQFTSKDVFKVLREIRKLIRRVEMDGGSRRSVQQFVDAKAIPEGGSRTNGG
ncbi:hypothetical protein LSAT2_006991, partial [Lamellibrachia satsuma]